MKYILAFIFALLPLALSAQVQIGEDKTAIGAPGNDGTDASQVRINNLSAEYSLSSPETPIKGFTETYYGDTSSWARSWSIYPSNAGQIVSQTNESVTVKWNKAGAAEVRIIFPDSSVASSYDVDVVGIAGPTEVALDTVETYQGDTSSWATSWAIYPSDAGEIISSNDSFIQVKWTRPGDHEVRIIYPDSSVAFSLTVDVNVCDGVACGSPIKGFLETYYGDTSSWARSWSIYPSSAGQIVSQTNESVTVKWNRIGAAEVRIIFPDGSVASSYDVDVVGIAGQTEVALDTTEVYQGDTSIWALSWAIYPSSAGQIISSDNSSITVKWTSLGHREVRILDPIGGVTSSLEVNVNAN